MGAEEILQVLRKGDKLTTSEIAIIGKLSNISVQHAIKRLVKDVSENVMFRPLTQDEKEERFGKKMGCKIYLYWIDGE